VTDFVWVGRAGVYADANHTMIAGSGADLFAFINGLAGGTDLIEGFNTAAGDRVTLQNYGADAVQSALASATVAGGSTAITLPDHTTILFQGVTNLSSAAFV
jgi:Ca2+-binding RTX toxin-like protein